MIADELRKFKGHINAGLTPEMVLALRAEVNAIADRIDAEHEKAIHELNRLAEASVLLPKDADGEYIHIGDVMYDCNESPNENFSVETMVLCRWGWSLIDYGELNEPSQCRHRPIQCNHYHKPTVEKLLEEMYDALDDARIPNGSEKRTYEEIIAEYAQKLQLREES